MTLKATQDRLDSWGRWIRGGTGLGYGNVLGELRGGGLPSAPISDDEALKIDRVISVLKQTNYMQYQCVKLSYAKKLSLRGIGREVGVSHQTVERCLSAAEHWLDVAFEIENI